MNFSNSQNAGPTLTEYLQDDHKRLDNLFEMTFLYLQAGNRDRAMATFQEFDKGLRHHIRMEDMVLFRLFEQKTGLTEGPTEVMRIEHRRIEEVLADILNNLENLPPSFSGKDTPVLTLLGLQQRLLEILGPHNAKEERILYPGCDRLITDKVSVIQEMESTP